MGQRGLPSLLMIAYQLLHWRTVLPRAWSHVLQAKLLLQVELQMLAMTRPAPPLLQRQPRRLQDVVMDVQISYAQSDVADAVAAGNTDVDWATAGFAATPTASDGVATVEMTFTVTASAQIEPPMVSDFETAFLAEGATVTASVGSLEVAYSIMPCSAATDVCAAGYTLRDNAVELACAGAECSSDDSGTCCTQVATAGAQHTCMLGSLSLLAFSTNLLF